MNERPTKIYLQGNVLGIDWSDGQRRLYEAAELRQDCPCAGCRGHYSGGPPPELAEIPPDIRITAVAPVGNYAYRIEFSDGHSTGIYTLDYLRELGREKEPG